MIKNFVNDEYLRQFYPKVSGQLWSEQSDYSKQINKAFDSLLSELQNRGINPRLCMTPLDLKLPDDATPNTPLTITTETATTTGEAFAGSYQRRLVVTVRTVTGTWTIKLQGSNNQTEPETGDSSWTDIDGAEIEIEATGEASVVFNDLYRWYRYVSIEDSAGSIEYGVYLVENILDDAIAYGTFILIFSDFIMETADLWDVRRAMAQASYDSALQSIKLSYDSNDDGVPDAVGEETNTSLTLKR